MPTNLSRLIELAKAVTVTEKDREEQRRSFVYGNTAFENEAITRERINSQAESLKARNHGS